MDLEKEKQEFDRGEMVMKLEHLLQGYKQNNINVEVKEMNDENERVGVITFCNGISASYLLDDEDIVVAIKIFFNCLTRDELKIQNQLNHIIKILNIMQNTIMLLSNIPQKECNMILDKLGMFDNTFKSCKQIRHLEHEYRVEVVQGLLCFSVSEKIKS